MRLLYSLSLRVSHAWEIENNCYRITLLALLTLGEQDHVCFPSIQCNLIGTADLASRGMNIEY